MRTPKFFLICAIMLVLSTSGLYAQGTHELDLTTAWKFQMDPANIGAQKGWQSPGFDSSSWQQIAVPGYWEAQGITQANPNWTKDDLNQPYSGYAWYRYSLVVPSDWKGRNVFLNLGRIDDMDWTYVNGALIGQTATYSPAVSDIFRSYAVPQSLVRYGYGQPNIIAVRVLDMRGVGGIVRGPVSLTLDKPASIDRQSGFQVEGDKGDRVRVVGNVLVEKGETVRDAVSVMGNVTVKGHVTGNAVAVMGNVNILRGAVVDGDVTAVMGNVTKSPDSTVGGQVTSVVSTGDHAPSRWWMPFFGGTWEGIALSSLVALGSGLLMAVLAAVIAALFPAMTGMIADASLQRPGLSILYGVMAFLLMIPIAVILVLTCVGILLIPVQVIFYIVAMLLGKVGISLALGRRLMDGLNKPTCSAPLAAFIGGVVLALIKMVPFLGGLISLVLTLIGLGAVLITGFGTHPDWLPMRLGGRRPA